MVILCSINRNIVECKVYPFAIVSILLSVLIETSWNVKDLKYILVPELHKY